jgi:hypothetical protein
MIDIGIIEQYAKEESKPKKNETIHSSIASFNPLQIAENMIAKAVDGEKHHVLCKASYLLGGYIETGKLSENDARKTLRNAIDRKQNVADIKAAYRTIDKCLEAGKGSPVYNCNGNFKKNLSKIEEFNFNEIVAGDDSKKKESTFPVEVFPNFIQKLITEANKTLYYPIDYLGSSLLCTVSIALGLKIIVEVKKGWTEQAVLYIALVGNPGDNKSHPLEFALKPIMKVQSEIYEEYKIALDQYRKLTDEEKQGQRPPVWKQYILNDFTNEALLSAHLYNLNGIGVYKDELMGWINEMNRYRNGGDEQFWISNFSGKPIVVNRKSGENYQIDHPFISVIGTVQPGIMDQIFTNEKSANGFTDRILFAYPENLSAMKRTELEIEGVYLIKYDEIIQNIISLAISDDKFVQSKTIGFDESAKKIFKDFYDTIQIERHKKTANSKVLEYSAKLISYVPRLALILQVLSWAAEGKRTNDQIDADSIIGAIKLVEYYKNCYSRIINEVKTKKKEAYTKEEVAFKMKEAGLTYKQIGESFNIGITTASDWVARATENRKAEDIDVYN